MNFNAHSRLGDIAVAFPPSMRVFEALGLDFCCGGQRELGEACAAAGLAPENVLEAIAGIASTESETSQDWREASLTALVEHLLATHHVFTRTELARLAPLMDKVARVHGEAHPELHEIRTAFIALFNDLGPHMMKEERILFPYMLALDSGQEAEGCFGTVANPIRAMESEHDGVGELLRQIRAISLDFTLPDSACGSYRSLFMGLADLEADLHQHIHLENNLLFPKALELEGAKSGV